MNGKELKTKRVGKLLTQAELSEITGIGMPVIDNIERGFITPNPETLEKLMQALGGNHGEDAHLHSEGIAAQHDSNQGGNGNRGKG